MDDLHPASAILLDHFPDTGSGPLDDSGSLGCLGHSLRDRRSIAVTESVWLATESFRSEGYYLRFSWLSTGYLLAPLPGVGRLAILGVYGLGGLLAWAAAWSDRGSLRASGPRLLGIMALLTGLASLPGSPVDSSDATLRVAGVQLEFPTIERVLTELDQLAEAHPNVPLFVLSEYTVDGLVPDGVRHWCRRHQRYVILGGKEPLGGTQFRNTAYVIDPKGTVVFQQAKSVPIQFFDDGLPAAEQRIWESPWGRIGLAICYDLSYRRVIDELIRGGAQALIVPTMDVEEWGSYQRALHTRIGSMRAAEYRLPVFRLASSGISQIVDATGKVLASGSYPGQGEKVSGEITLPRRARLPWDVWLTPLATAGTVVLLTVLGLRSIYTHFARRARVRANGVNSAPSGSSV
jgi:apolipoprotein N-acyltransferase